MPHQGRISGRSEADVWLDGLVAHGFDFQDAFTGVRRAAQIVWRGVNGIGVRFTRLKPTRQHRAGFGRRRR